MSPKVTSSPMPSRLLPNRLASCLSNSLCPTPQSLEMRNASSHTAQDCCPGLLAFSHLADEQVPQAMDDEVRVLPGHRAWRRRSSSWLRKRVWMSVSSSLGNRPWTTPGSAAALPACPCGRGRVMIFSVRTWCSSVWISSVGTVEHPAWPQLVGPRLETSGLLGFSVSLPG